jgi:hypothetical protein
MESSSKNFFLTKRDSIRHGNLKEKNSLLFFFNDRRTIIPVLLEFTYQTTSHETFLKNHKISTQKIDSDEISVFFKSM